MLVQGEFQEAEEVLGEVEENQGCALHQLQADLVKLALLV